MIVICHEIEGVDHNTHWGSPKAVDTVVDYITDKTADFTVSASDDEIMAEDNGTGLDKGYLESLAVYRKIAESILKYNGFLMHGVAADVVGCGIAFLAKSGVGKSTHTKLWKEFLKDKMIIVNADKPLMRELLYERDRISNIQ